MGAPNYPVPGVGVYAGRVEIRSGASGHLISARDGRTIGGFFGSHVTTSWNARHLKKQEFFILSKGQGTTDDWLQWSQKKIFISALDLYQGPQLERVDRVIYGGKSTSPASYLFLWGHTQLTDTVQTGPYREGVGVAYEFYEQLDRLHADGRPEDIMGRWSLTQHHGATMVTARTGYYAHVNDQRDPYLRDGQFQTSAVSVGDWDGDGTPDYAFGEPYYSADRGRVLIFSGRSTASFGVQEIILKRLYGEVGSAGKFGASLGAADIDGNGTLDLVVGAPYFSIPDTDDLSGQAVGRVYIFAGQTGLPLTQLSRKSAMQSFGCAVSNVGRALGASADRIAISSVAGCHGLPMHAVGTVDVFRFSSQ